MSIRQRWSKKYKKLCENKCFICGTKQHLEVHHILSKHLLSKNNKYKVSGICLCHRHHSGFHVLFGKMFNNELQLKQFILEVSLKLTLSKLIVYMENTMLNCLKIQGFMYY